MSTTATLRHSPRAPRRGRPRHSVKQLAARVLNYYRENQGEMEGGVVEVPSERDLAEHFGVTRHAVRNALEHLDVQGDLKRVSGRGSYLLSAAQAGEPSAGPGLKCINFIQAPVFQDPTLQWVVSQYLAGYTEVLERYQLKTRFVFCSDDETHFDQLLWDQLPWTQQGCVLVNRMVPGLLDWLHEQGVAYVMQYARLYEGELALRPHHRVYVNKIGGGAEATRHLLELGHRRIGFVGPFPGQVRMGEYCGPEFEGYCSVMRCEGLSLNPDDMLHASGEVASAVIEPCKKFLSENRELTAVVTANGGMAEGLLLAAEAVGIDVPGRLSVVGFSGASPQVESRLTHIRIPQRELAHSAVELLLGIADHKPDDFKTRVLHCELVHNHTTAPPSS